jgi:predicted Fe-Mo cluster-binding NifX family protein
MKIIAVSAMNPSLNSPIDPRFGRCRYLVFVDAETMELEAVENPNITSLTGAGLETAKLVANRGTRLLLTGYLGPNTEQALSAAGIKVLTGVEGTVAQAVERYKESMPPPPEPPAEPPEPAPYPGAKVTVQELAKEPAPYPEAEVPTPEPADLKSQLLALSQQLSEIQRRIEELAEKAG